VSNKVFILGAGASKHTGAPLMADFLDRARDLYAAGNMPSDWAEHFDRVFRAISALQDVHSKSSLDIRNLESVFTTFEMAKNIGRLSDLPANDVSKCVESMQAVIFYTLDQCVLFPTTGITGTLCATDVYRGFAECINTSSKDDITIITFNYDIALDVALAKADLDVFYGLESSPTTPFRRIKLLKLHGSLGWGLTKATTPKIVSCPPAALTEYLQPGRRSAVSINLVTRLKQLIKSHCRADIEDLPVLVPPGMYKAHYQGALTQVWRTAADALKNADEIFVFGYSLPETDFFFQNLYALGTVGDKLLRKFYVFDPNPEIQARFERLLGHGVKRPVFDFTAAYFDQGVQVGAVVGGKVTQGFFGSLERPMSFSNQ
jgi:hypothetical protein